jgi:hypothetical protein
MRRDAVENLIASLQGFCPMHLQRFRPAFVAILLLPPRTNGGYFDNMRRVMKMVRC